VLKATLATDAVIGAAISPKHGGSAYVLLHHVMGEAAGRKGVWAYVRGGMGAVTQALAARAREKGVTVVENAVVDEINFKYVLLAKKLKSFVALFVLSLCRFV